mmetsp:Transcript_30848/g.58574  ORF Transcript_30848/g.58574 Transcript_30848/m.58574 type:complete len:83 (+) Transcript_30848:38-286(+)
MVQATGNKQQATGNKHEPPAQAELATFDDRRSPPATRSWLLPTGVGLDIGVAEEIQCKQEVSRKRRIHDWMDKRVAREAHFG